MKRRDVLGLGALGLGAATLDGCAIFPWPQRPPMSERDLEKILAELDARLEKIRGAKSTVHLVEIGKLDASAEDAGRDAVAKIVAALHVIGTYRDIPESARTLEHVEKHFAENVPEAFETIGGARDWIKQTARDDFAKLDRRLKRDPNAPMKIMERVDELGKELEIPIEQRAYLRTATAQLTSRFRDQGTRAVVDDVVQKWDRAIARQSALLGAPQEETHAQQPEPQAITQEPVRVRYFTTASEQETHRATCLLRPTITIDDRERPVDLQWRTARAHECGPAQPNAIRGFVEMSQDPENARSIVVVTLEPPENAPPEVIEDLRAYTRDIASELRRRTAIVAPRAVVAQADDDEPKASSARLMRTVRKTAKWGAILLIPPICFVGILILLVCLFMVIVAGFESASGD